MALLSRYQSQTQMGFWPYTSTYSTNSSESYLYGKGYMEQSQVIMEKRQVFLRSYQFSRKLSLTERIKRSLVRAKRVLWVRLRSAKRLRKVVWSRLRSAVFNHRRRRFIRLRSGCGYGCRSSYCFL